MTLERVGDTFVRWAIFPLVWAQGQRLWKRLFAVVLVLPWFIVWILPCTLGLMAVLALGLWEELKKP
jgi:hypothetical protein